MGTTLGQINQRIQRDRQTQLDKSYRDELADEEKQEEEYMKRHKKDKKHFRRKHVEQQNQHQQQQHEPKYKVWLNKCFRRQQSQSQSSQQQQYQQSYDEKQMSSQQKQFRHNKRGHLEQQQQRIVRQLSGQNSQFRQINGRRQYYWLLDVLEQVVREYNSSGQGTYGYEYKVGNVSYKWQLLEEYLNNHKQQLQRQSQSSKASQMGRKLQQLIAISNNNRYKNTDNNNNNNYTMQLYITKISQINTNNISDQEIVVAEKVIVNNNRYRQSNRLYQLQRQQQQLQKSQQQQWQRVNLLLYHWRVRVAQLTLHKQYAEQNQLPIVHVYDVVVGDQNHKIIDFNKTPTKNNNLLTIYQQPILYNLSKVRTLTHLQGLYVLQQCFLGFMMLYHVVGGFDIDQQMIGFNIQGRVKVWLSPVFQSNLCRQYQGQKQKSNNFKTNKINNILTQQQMVTTIYMIVQKYSLFNKQLIYHSRGFRNCTFQKAIDIIQRHKYQLIVKSRLRRMDLYNSRNNNGHHYHQQCYQQSQNKQEQVRFVSRLRFQKQQQQQQHEQIKLEKDQSNQKRNLLLSNSLLFNNQFYNNNTFLKEMMRQNIGGDVNNSRVSLINGMRIENVTKQKQNVVTSNPQLLKTKLPLPATQTSLQSHITIINKLNDNNKVNNRNNTFQRPSIFPNGYQRSMSNNNTNQNSRLMQQQSQVNERSVYNNNNYYNKNYNNNYNYDHNKHETNPHATFITIKSSQYNNRG